MFDTWNVFIYFIYQSIICARTDTILSNFLTPHLPFSPKDISCHKLKCFGNGECMQMLPKIDHEFRPPNKTMYFVESSCQGGLRSLQMCAIESAAYANPNWKIIVVFAGPLKTKFWNSNNHSLLKSIPNLRLYRVNTRKFAKGTALEDIFTEDEVSLSRYPVVHTSDLLRILILYKYGGLYLDLDMIVMKSFDTLPTNFLPRETTTTLGSSILAVSRNKIGRKFTDKSVRYLADNYDPLSWAGGTSGVYTHTLQNICHTKMVSKMNAKKCQGFHVLNHTSFYPVPEPDWYLYYTTGDTMIDDSEAYTHHVWNSLGSQVADHISPKSFFISLAKVYCPRTYDLYKDKFGQ